MGLRIVAFSAAFLGLIAMAVGTATAAGAEESEAIDRGRLLYDTYCVQCHTQQVHWRERRLASDWQRLKAEVVRWQRVAGQRWDDRDVTDVARFLNDLFYQHPEDPGPMPAVSPGSPR